MSKYGSLTNHLTDGMTCAAPTVGEAATMLSWTDRHPGTVVAVGPMSKAQPGLPTWVDVQEDTAIRTDDNGMSECQRYTYERNPSGSVTRYTLRPRGQYRRKGGDTRVMFGRREKYHDYSF